ncbi:MAG: DUF4392 domain-containing protein [Oscillospiraceae bacterium]|jgi:hypothetical protein|nr:DUF4392 domain-containing protein [Oscillospiraceae bacterium]
MTQQELTERNLGQSLDDLSNLDPRGYGVCKILYEASRAKTGEPLTMHAAKQLVRVVKRDDIVFILVGFVLLPFKKAEMDGVVSAVLLARSLVKSFGAKPVLVCPQDNVEAIRALSACVGLHCYDSIEDVKQMPIALAVLPFTKERDEAAAQADLLIAQGDPSAVISIEAPGANHAGVYHNATGLNVTELEAKMDILFTKLQDKGVLNIAIGDLGNEIGMGAIAEQLYKYIPYAGEGACRCDCKGGIAVATAADHIITATVSDWGCYGMIAALAFLLEDIDIMHDARMQEEAMITASRAGMIDMYGWLVPAIDGFGLPINTSIVTLMRECVQSALHLRETCATWFEKVIEKGFFRASR